MENLQNILNFSENLVDKLSLGITCIFILIWIWGIIWISKDIQARTDSVFKEIIFILIFGILGPIGRPFYIILRPSQYKRDKIGWRETLLTQVIQCPECGELNPREYNYCINCGTKLKVKCKECQKEFPYEYEFCPYCGAPKII